MVNIRRITALFAVIAVCAGGVSFAAGNTVIVKGSTTVLPIAQIAAEHFMNENPQADISIQGGGSGVGIAALIDGTCDIADASRSIKDKEIDKALENGIEPVAHVVAMDGIAVILHPSNDIDSMTKQQIKDIYTGKTSNWSEVGADNTKIVVISRDSNSGTYEAFKELALDGEKVRPDALLQASNQAVLTTIAKTPGAIGYVGLGYVNSTVKALVVDGILPTKETVLSGDYILSRPLFMYTNGTPTGMVKEFIDYVLGSEGQRLVEEVGYIGLEQ